MNCKSLPLISATATECAHIQRFPVDTIGITTEGSAFIWGKPYEVLSHYNLVLFWPQKLALEPVQLLPLLLRASQL